MNCSASAVRPEPDLSGDQQDPGPGCLAAGDGVQSGPFDVGLKGLQLALPTEEPSRRRAGPASRSPPPDPSRATLPSQSANGSPSAHESRP